MKSAHCRPRHLAFVGPASTWQWLHVCSRAFHRLGARRCRTAHLVTQLADVHLKDGRLGARKWLARGGQHGGVESGQAQLIHGALCSGCAFGALAAIDPATRCASAPLHRATAYYRA